MVVVGGAVFKLAPAVIANLLSYVVVKQTNIYTIFHYFHCENVQVYLNKDLFTTGFVLRLISLIETPKCTFIIYKLLFIFHKFIKVSVHKGKSMEIYDFNGRTCGVLFAAV